MNLFNIFSDLEAKDPEFSERISPRRDAIKNMTGFGAKVAMAAMPMALGSLLKKAYGQSASGAVEVLNYALTLEYLEYHFYNHAVVVSNSMISGAGGSAALGAITTIRDHEKAHVDLLAGAIKQANGTPVSFKYEDFDFTAGGTFPTVYSDYKTFLAVANAFEDTGVRAYKGRATDILGTDYLTVALQIHSVEARHASHIRQMRKAPAGGGLNIKPWITGANDTGVSQVDAVYKGEDNVLQAKIDITTLAGVNGNISKSAAQESFDEPLTKEEVLAIAGLFIRK
ncbi:MAG: ferritin-like domain-containing protein [Mucilaginibacter polytrichastri]|nr:ferritin-like domain-containing protein [Mucilaginibacter polytrichastri]